MLPNINIFPITHPPPSSPKNPYSSLHYTSPSKEASKRLLNIKNITCMKIFSLKHLKYQRIPFRNSYWTCLPNFASLNNRKSLKPIPLTNLEERSVSHLT